jgi:plastocyanin
MTLRSWTRALGVAALGVAVSGVARHAAAADGAPPTAADLTRLEGEIARLQQELRDQRQLVLQLMQMQEALLRYLNTGGTPPGSPPGPLGAAAPPPGSASAKAAHTVAALPSSAATAAITGHAHVGAGAPREAYVYLDGPRTLSSHPPSIEIRQADRQFVPAVAVVPTGAQILFPNRDTVFHNVFSNTPGDAFDVGTLKAGDTPKPVTMLKPGHVEIFCNIHSKMRADVLVVPNAHWTRVHPDGTFVLPGIPVGSRRIVVWGPGLKPVAQQVEVTAEGAIVNLTTDAAPPTPHMNKQGAAYGSYEN